MRRCALYAVFACFTIFVSAAALSAEGSVRCFGLRAGYGMDPDQFVIGGQADLARIFGNLHLVSSIDAGFGDNMTTFAFNPEVNLFLPLPKSSASLYGILGPSLVLWSPEEGDGDTEIGVTLGLGTRIAMGKSGWYNFEARFGIGDIPETRILFGLLSGGR
jgi:hypothetical protein